ncbi:hypothetical protein D3C86_1881140 [compost metagenome]
MLAVEKHGNLFAQHRHFRETHTLFTLFGRVGQHHIYPALGGIEQAAFPIAKHDDLHLITQLAQYCLDHGRCQPAYLLAVAPGNRRIHRVVAITHDLPGPGLARK